MRRIPRAWIAVSEGILFIELRATAMLLAALALFILTNVFTRYAGYPLYWIDELAVFTMVWLAFIGTSAMCRLKLDFAVSFLADWVPGGLSPAVRMGGVVLVAIFGAALLWMCWLLFDPSGMAAAGFDGRRLAAETFNFLYTEHTQTLGWPRWVVLLAVPLFGLCIVVHSIANLIEEAGLSPPVQRAPLGSATAEVGS